MPIVEDFYKPAAGSSPLANGCRLKIECGMTAPDRANHIWLNGIEISKYCTAVSFHMGVGEISTATITLSAAIELVGDPQVTVKLPDAKVTTP